MCRLVGTEHCTLCLLTVQVRYSNLVRTYHHAFFPHDNAVLSNLLMSSMTPWYDLLIHVLATSINAKPFL